MKGTHIFMEYGWIWWLKGNAESVLLQDNNEDDNENAKSYLFSSDELSF